jgi:hypothetical protein
MKYIISALALVTTVAAHGYVNTALIGGQTYTIYKPYAYLYRMSPSQTSSVVAMPRVVYRALPLLLFTPMSQPDLM